MRSAEATIRDVARQADVSVASVSRALNGHSNVHPDTRARVIAAATTLGYVPHAGARSLSMARTHALGVVLPDLHGEFFSEIVRGMDREADARGYHLLVSNMHADVELAGQAIRSMRGRVDGLIVMAPQIDPDALAATLPRGIPSVLVNTRGRGGRHAFRVDNIAGAAAMVGHLAASGRRAIVHVAGPPGNIDARERREGYCAAMTDNALPIRVIDGDFFEESGAAAVAALHAAGDAFDAIFAANDMMALGAMQALRDGGIAVPDAVAVAGFDDIPLARYMAMTTMRVHLAELGARAIARLIDELSGTADTPMTELIVPDLVVRATTGMGTA